MEEAFPVWTELYQRRIADEVKALGEERFRHHQKALQQGARFLGWYGVARSKIQSSGELPEGFLNAQSLYWAGKASSDELERGVSKERGSVTDTLSRMRVSIDFEMGEPRLTRGLIREYIGALQGVSAERGTSVCQAFLESVVEESFQEGMKQEYASVRSKVKGFELNGYSCEGFMQKRARPVQESISLEDVGGNEEAKREVSYLIKAFQDPCKQDRWGYVFPKGVLFYGPPGTGKTLLARALAQQTELDFVEIQVTDFLSKWAGESERQLAEALSGEGRIFFLDELDSIGRDKRLMHSEIGINIVNILALKMNEVSKDHFSLYVAATNEVKSIDKKLRSPHRFSRIIPFHYPGPGELEEIGRIHWKKRLGRVKEVSGYHVEEDWLKALATRSQELAKMGKPRLVGADVAEVVERAFEVCFRRDLDGKNKGLPSLEDFLKVISSYDTLREEVGVGV